MTHSAQHVDPVDPAAGLAELMEAIRNGRRAARWRGPHAALTEEDREALVPWLDSDLCVRDIARELGWDPGKVYRVADRYGLPIRARRRPPLRNIEAIVAEMRPIEAVAYLTEAYLNLTGEEAEREMQLVTDYRLSPSEAKLFAVLEAHAGQVVSHEKLLTVFEQAGYEGSDLKDNIKVFLSKLRASIKRNRMPVVIDTAHCMGYRLRRLEPSPCST